MYRKLFVSLFAVALIFGFTGISMANGSGPYSDSWQGAGGDAGFNYDAHSPNTAFGGGHAKIYAPKGSSLPDNPYVAGAYSSQKVDSSAWADGPTNKKDMAKAFGEAGQYSGAVVNRANGNFAAGKQSSGAGYYAFDKSKNRANANGNAKTIGGTLVGAKQINSPSSSTGIAGAITGSAGKAKAGCHKYDTDAWGDGTVEHGTYANTGNGQAWTGGNATYKYNNDGYRSACGAGFAATGGISNVTYHNNGSITASAMSGSISSTGNGAHTSGGAYISSFPTP